MNQMSFGGSECAAKKKRTRRDIFLGEMEQVIPCASLLKLIEPWSLVAGRSWPSVENLRLLPVGLQIAAPCMLHSPKYRAGWLPKAACERSDARRPAAPPLPLNS